MSFTGTIYNIQHFSIHDGPGIRTTVFFKGCPLACWWCHNPESRSYEIQPMNGKLVGKTYSTDELLQDLLKDQVFYDESGGGVTFSGGEPMAQIDFLVEMLTLLKAKGIQTAVDTSGYTQAGAFKRVLPLTDLFLYDLKLIDEELHIKYTDESNKIILRNLIFLLQQGARVIVRIPLVPGISITPSNVSKTLDFLKNLDPSPEINLLPYHRIASGKYTALNLENKMQDVKEIDDKEIQNTLQLFLSAGLQATIGG